MSEKKEGEIGILTEKQKRKNRGWGEIKRER